jgi:hypothetical protein
MATDIHKIWMSDNENIEQEMRASMGPLYNSLFRPSMVKSAPASYPPLHYLRGEACRETSG